MSQPKPLPDFDATLTSRYECKYLIDRSTADGLRRYLEAHAELDPYSARSPDHRYRVMSLYLDSPSLQLYEDTAQGVRNRFKLRVRYYKEELAGAIFLEVKKRADVIVRKNRELVTAQQASEFLRSGHCTGLVGGEDLHEFVERCREADAHPAVRVRYWREAWESRGVDPVRITFDTEVEHCIVSDQGLVEHLADWRRTPIGAPVILEVKFTDYRPHWLDRMLRMFQLDKVSVAKYAESVEDVQATGRMEELRARMNVAAHWRRMTSLGEEPSRAS